VAEPRGPLQSIWSGVLLIFAACLVLWLAVKLLESIWPWLLGAAILVLAVWALVAWRRWSRQRW
jgi:MFS superfamily sulfate permease-like transporter